MKVTLLGKIDGLMGEFNKGRIVGRSRDRHNRKWLSTESWIYSHQVVRIEES